MEESAKNDTFVAWLFLNLTKAFDIIYHKIYCTFKNKQQFIEWQSKLKSLKAILMLACNRIQTF